MFGLRDLRVKQTALVVLFEEALGPEYCATVAVQKDGPNLYSIYKLSLVGTLFICHMNTDKLERSIKHIYLRGNMSERAARWGYDRQITLFAAFSLKRSLKIIKEAEEGTIITFIYKVTHPRTGHIKFITEHAVIVYASNGEKLIITQYDVDGCLYSAYSIKAIIETGNRYVVSTYTPKPPEQLFLLA